MAEMECAEQVYVALKLEQDRRQREYVGVERTPDAMCIWSAYAVIGYFRLQQRKDRRLITETKQPGEGQFEVDDEGQVFDLKGNPVEGLTAPPLEENEDPEEFLDKELDGLARAQQLERARLWTPGVN